ncbi:hypothetical protein BJ912DRAFT_1007421 [Pholiota molesta]|nr:hypothetical protein BJ912DRAFT_1007421 [Pholiota molesta]
MRRRVVVPSCHCTVVSLRRHVVAPSRVVVVVASLRIVVVAPSRRRIIAPSRHCAVASLAAAERPARRSAVRARRFVVVTSKRTDQLGAQRRGSSTPPRCGDVAVHGPAARRGREPHSGGARWMRGKRAAVRHGTVMRRVVGGVVVCKRRGRVTWRGGRGGGRRRHVRASWASRASREGTWRVEGDVVMCRRRGWVTW